MISWTMFSCVSNWHFYKMKWEDLFNSFPGCVFGRNVHPRFIFIILVNRRISRKSWKNFPFFKYMMVCTSDQIIFSQYFTGLSQCCPANKSHRAFSSWMESWGGRLAVRPGLLAALVIVFFRNKSFWSSPCLLDKSSDNSVLSVRTLAKNTCS